jgi:hypothetical protein
VQGFYGRRTATYRDFVINEVRPPDAFYEGVDEVVVEIDPLSLGADYWDQNRHVQLTAKENAIYHMVDTMKTIPRFRTYVDMISTLVTGYYEKGKVELGPYFTTLSFNPVEGARFRLGGRTSNNFSTWVEFEGYTAYGLTDERFKFGLATRGFISKQPRLLYRAAYKHDVEQLGPKSQRFPQRQPARKPFPAQSQHQTHRRGGMARQFGAGVVLRVHHRAESALPHPASTRGT